MKQKNIIINITLSIIALVAIALAVIVISKRPTSEEVGQIKIELIDIDKNIISEKTHPFESNDTLFKILDTNYEVLYEVSAYGKFLTKIDNLVAPKDGSTFIRIEINGEISTVGVDGIKLKNNDTITFRIVKIGDFSWIKITLNYKE